MTDQLKGERGILLLTWGHLRTSDTLVAPERAGSQLRDDQQVLLVYVLGEVGHTCLFSSLAEV